MSTNASPKAFTFEEALHISRHSEPTPLLKTLMLVFGWCALYALLYALLHALLSGIFATPWVCTSHPSREGETYIQCRVVPPATPPER